MTSSIDLFEAISTQRGIRQFKADPIPDEMIHRLLRAAIKAPSGGARQGWSFIVIREQSTKDRIAELYRAHTPLAITPTMTEQQQKMYATAIALEGRMETVPAMILCCIQRSEPTATFTLGSSIYPAVQNILLAARGMGLGSVLTTRQRRFEEELKSLLGIPEDVETAALLPLGFPIDGVEYGPTRRRPVREVAHSERWGNSWQRAS